MSPWAWQDHANCRDQDPGITLFFAPDGEKYDTGARLRREERAKALCAACPVAAECLGYALAAPEKAGIWGHMNEDEREAERHRRMRRTATAARRTGRAA